MPEEKGAKSTPAIQDGKSMITTKGKATTLNKVQVVHRAVLKAIWVQDFGCEAQL